MQTTKLIIFDCDGTLVDSQHLIAESMRLAFIGLDLPPPSRQAILRTVGLSIPEAVYTLASQLGEAARNSLAQSYRAWCQSLRQQPEMQEPMFRGASGLMMDLAAQENIILGLATGKSRRGVDRFLAQNDLKGIFATIQTADTAPSKPHPAMIEQAMHETGATPAETVMIGDTSYDMIMARMAGVNSIGVLWGHHSLTELKRAGAKRIVKSFAELKLALLSDGVSAERHSEAA